MMPRQHAHARLDRVTGSMICHRVLSHTRHTTVRERGAHESVISSVDAANGIPYITLSL